MVKRSSAASRLLLVVCAWAFAMPGSAQTTAVSVDETYTPEPAHVAYIDGSATVTRDGRAEPAAINVPLVSGDQVRTSDGRVEVLFGDGSVLDIDQFSTVDFLSDELLRLTDGRIRITIGGRDRVAYRVDTPSAAVRIDTPGEYRIALIGESARRDVELVTVRGFATLVNDLGETSVRAGERAFATGTMAPSYAQAYNSATWDAFDRWAVDRRDERTGTTSAQYLPAEIRGYAGDFDRYGAWQYDVSYGYVWYPRVHADWRPYYNGRWSYYGPWGWTWIAYDHWGWPTHHYGRWGLRAGVWFWIPSHYWGPAHVYWAGASNYVGWCPLGWDNRPVFSINVGYGYNGYRGYGPYHAWTVMPRHAFHNHVDVGRYAVPRNQLEHAVPRWYVSGASAPIRPALARGTVTPIYSAGRNARTAAATPATRGGREAYTPGVSAAGSVPSTGRQEDRSRARARDVEASAPREFPGGTPGTQTPRVTPPATRGTLGRSADWQRSEAMRSRGEPLNADAGAGSAGLGGGRASTERATTRSRAPYQDAGPGGPEPRYEPQTDAYRAPRPGTYGRGPTDARGADIGAPRGVPQGGIYGPRGVPRDTDNPTYAPRGVPRTGQVYAPPPPQRSEPSSSYDPRPAPSSRARPESPRGGAYMPRPERPSYGPPSSAPGPSRSAPAAERPSGGGERAGARGGGSAPAASRPSGGSSGGHSRRPQ